MPDQIDVFGAGKPGHDTIPVPTQQESLVAALLEERRGYEQSRDAGAETRHGVPVVETLRKIDGEIRRLGGTPPADAAPVKAGAKKPANGW